MNGTSQQVCEELLSLVERLKHAILELAEKEGITRMQFFALYFIQQNGELAMGKVADVLYCDASNVTGIVDRLVAQGLVIRQESPRDRRTKTIRLTPKGQHIVHSIREALPSRLGCENLSQAEQIALRDLVHKVTA